MKKSKERAVDSGIKMTDIDCVQCGLRFFIQDSFYETVVKGGYPFYCPRGHSLEHKEGAEKLREKQRLEREKEATEKKALEAQIVKTIWDRILPWR